MAVVTHFFKRPDEIGPIIEAIVSDYPALCPSELGLSELMLNAIEHGNCGISFDEKTAFLESGLIIDEIERRLSLPDVRDRQAFIEVRPIGDELIILVVDDGDGFDWKPYLDKDIADVTGVHGRGIVLSEVMFKTLTYIGKGNKVVAVVDNDA